jgi:hypothetical protein
MIAPFRAEFEATTRTFVRDMFPPGSDESMVERVAADMSSALLAITLGGPEGFNPHLREVIEELLRSVATAK